MLPASDTDEDSQPTQADYTLRPNIKIHDIGECRRDVPRLGHQVLQRGNAGAKMDPRAALPVDMTERALMRRHTRPRPRPLPLPPRVAPRSPPGVPNRRENR